MKLDRDFYKMSEVAEMLGLTNHKLWRLRLQLGFETRTRGDDKRVKWVSAETVQRIYDYLNNPQ